nr:MAG TPA: hypothetical protein [Caudoviricetes sp.]
MLGQPFRFLFFFVGFGSFPWGLTSKNCLLY